MTLELAWLRTWVEVVDTGGFTRAADKLHLSQPRVSAHIANLERELGCLLIERRIRPLTLTDDGRALLARARAVLAAADELVTARQTDLGNITGSVTVASFASASAEFLPGVITSLQARYPGIRVAVLDGDVDFIEAALSERRVSVALRTVRPEPHDHAFTMRPLWREPYVMLAPTGHPLLKKSEVELADFANQRVITIGDPLANTVVGYEAEVELSIQNLVSPNGIVSHQPTTLGAMVRAGHGLGIINHLGAVMILREGMEMRPLHQLNRFRDVGVWWHSERPLGAAAQAFIRAVMRAPRPEGTTAIPPV
ncbi:LysR family transcriptional regulator [Streptomyces hokutonensis]|uniref:LysR family transcriptional regulator n=1 Tax=Streptomyces hokutonensis TaxID=1306990 RepID=UPI00036EE21E|nr:LysR family transcriptional regulator [Streptomyces hokutonensis]